MKEANFSNHAKKRIGERCSLSQKEIKRILDNDGTVVIHLQKGGRYAHRLLYSIADEDWFMVVQDGGDGGVLTVMPLEYLKGRTPVTAAHKRLARNRARKLENKTGKIPESAPQISQQVATVKNLVVKDIPPFPGWRISVHYISNGRAQIKKLASRTPEDFGGPDDWQEPGMIHHWIKCQLIASAIPLTAIKAFFASKGKITEKMDSLLENLPLTEAEINMFR